MRTPYNPNQSPRVIIIQKLYGNFFNDDTDLTFPKHRFKKFIKDVVLGTIERDEVIKEEVKKYLSEDILLTNLDKVFQIIVKSAIFEFLYKPKVSTKIIIKEYLDASNFFIFFEIVMGISNTPGTLIILIILSLGNLSLALFNKPLAIS